MPFLRTLSVLTLLGAAALLGAVSTASAQTAGVSESTTDVVKARELFVKGTTLVRAAQWAEALGAFEQSSRLRPHPITTYNIGACERALGRYTVARASLQRAIAGEPNVTGELPASLRAEAQGYIAEIERLLVHVDLKLAPVDALVAVDGRPLAAREAAGAAPEWVAGLRPPGRGEALPAARLTVVLDPGTHLFTLSRKGFSDQLVTKTFKPGARQALTLNLDRLPAHLRVSSNEPRSRVRIDQLDVGYAPVDVERPSGSYFVSIEKPGFVAYETSVKLNPGEASTVDARLGTRPLTQRWWFWTAAGVIVTGAVIGTYYATRSEPTPERPPLDGGGLGWTLQVP
jgi:hypothetical protein